MSQPVMLMCAIAFYVGIYHLIFFIIRKENIQNLYFAFICFSIALYDVACIGLYNSLSVTSSAFWQRCQYFSIELIAASFFFFTYSICDRKRDRFLHVFCAVLASLFALGFIFPEQIFSAAKPLVRQVNVLFINTYYNEAEPGVLMNLLFAVLFISMVYLFALLVRSLVKEGKRHLWPVVIGFAVFFISAIMDIMIGMDAVRFVYTAEYSFLIIIFMMDYTLLRRFVGLVLEIEGMNVMLENKVLERTIKIQSMADEVIAVNKELEDMNVELADLVERDSLTRLYNHAAFQKKLDEVMNMSKRNSVRFCMAMMDIDWFKQINDKYGHIIGDQVILKVAEILRARPGRASQPAEPETNPVPGIRNYDVAGRFREYDVAGRYGGDEFAVLFLYCGENEIRIITDRIQKCLRNIIIEGCPDISVTLSIGIVVIDNPVICGDRKEIIKKADNALYEAKDKGRNQAVIAMYNDSFVR